MVGEIKDLKEQRKKGIVSGLISEINKTEDIHKGIGIILKYDKLIPEKAAQMNDVKIEETKEVQSITDSSQLVEDIEEAMKEAEAAKYKNKVTKEEMENDESR